MPKRLSSTTPRVQASTAPVRTFREHKSSGEFVKPNPSGPYRLTVQFPLPVGKSLLNPFADDEDITRIRLFDQGDWPGGVIQQFRALRPLVEELLEGYGVEFVGMLGASEDGMGVWKLDDTTVVSNVVDITFAKFADLCNGKFGKKPLDPEHTIIVVNPGWTSSKEIGQPWDWALRQQARELIEECTWEPLYHCEMLRTASGANGLMHRAYPGPWQLFPAPAEDADALAACALESARRPATSEVTRALTQAQPELTREFEQYLKERRQRNSLF